MRSSFEGCVDINLSGWLSFSLFIFSQTFIAALGSYPARAISSTPIRSASVSCVRENGSVNVYCAAIFKAAEPRSPSPAAELATAIPTSFICSVEARSRLCSRSACDISCPRIAASSASVSFSFSMIPVYTTMRPPGIHQALIVGSLMTFTCQFHFSASLRNAPT